MTRWGIVNVVVLGLFSSVALSQSRDGSVSAEQQKRLIEQKLRLVESLVNSPSAQASSPGHGAEVQERMQNGRNVIERVRKALAANQLDQASAALDEALRSATKASARSSNKPGELSTGVLQSNYENLSGQVASYRRGIEDLAKQGNSEAKNVVARIHGLQADAGKLADTGKLGDANRKLADAYKLAIESTSKLRAGQTVTLSLKFDTPLEEYDYERRRYQSNEILVNMMIGEGHIDENRRNILPGFENVTGEGLPEGGRRTMVDGLVREATQQRGLAVEKAQGGDHKGAVTLMEKATAKLNRALQVMGVPIF